MNCRYIFLSRYLVMNYTNSFSCLMKIFLCYRYHSKGPLIIEVGELDLAPKTRLKKEQTKTKQTTTEPFFFIAKQIS